MSLKSLQSFILTPKTITIYHGEDITVADEKGKKPSLKQDAQSISLSIHAITAAQMDHIQTVRNSVAPPIITRINNGISNSEENTSDPDYLSRKEKANNLSTALVVFYGCDSIRKDTMEESTQDDSKDEANEKAALLIVKSLPLPVIDDIANQILNINHPGLSADFFSAGS